jgi:hypothetical protein
VSSILRLIHERQRLWPLAAMVAMLSLFGLDAAYVLHHVVEDACPAEESGDPFDCYLCTALLRVGLDVPSTVVCLVPQPGEILPPPEAVALPTAGAPHPASARAPPAAIL